MDKALDDDTRAWWLSCKYPTITEDVGTTVEHLQNVHGLESGTAAELRILYKYPGACKPHAREFHVPWQVNRS